MRILAGQSVLLTGASGGLGSVMTQAFANRKVKLGLVAYPGTDLEALANSVAGRAAQTLVFATDLRDPAQRREAFEQINKQFGQIDILVNNAGVEFTSPYHELSEAQIYEVLGVNLEAP